MVSTVLQQTIPIVLLVEDDVEDQELVRRAFQKSGYEADLRIMPNGKEAMDYLLRQGAFSDPAEHANHEWPGGAEANCDSSRSAKNSCRRPDHVGTASQYTEKLRLRV